jgi:hypothetical protein
MILPQYLDPEIRTDIRLEAEKIIEVNQEVKIYNKNRQIFLKNRLNNFNK